MFSGLVLGVGRIRSKEAAGNRNDPRQARASGSRRLAVWVGPEIAPRLAVGSSLSVAGVCLTVVAAIGEEVHVDLSPETLARTRFGESIAEGGAVNLEPALRAGDELGGHWVQGHVDGVISLVERRDLGEHRELGFEVPADSARLIVEKGSIALDGVSLTLASVSSRGFSVALIPHTLAATTLGELRVGDRVHVEYDVLGKYVDRWMSLR